MTEQYDPQDQRERANPIRAFGPQTHFFQDHLLAEPSVFQLLKNLINPNIQPDLLQKAINLAKAEDNSEEPPSQLLHKMYLDLTSLNYRITLWETFVHYRRQYQRLKSLCAKIEPTYS